MKTTRMGAIVRAILLARVLACCLGDDVNLESPPSVVPPTVNPLPSTAPADTFPGLGSRTIFPPNFENDFINRVLGLTTMPKTPTTTTTTTTVAPFPGISVQRPIVLPTVFPDNFGNDFLNRILGTNNATTAAASTSSFTTAASTTAASTTATATSTTQSPVSESSTATTTATTGTTNPTNELIANALALGNIVINQLLRLLFGPAPAQG